MYFMVKQQQMLSKSFANGGHTFILLLNYQIHLHHSLVILCYPKEGYQFSGDPRKRNIIILNSFTTCKNRMYKEDTEPVNELF